MIKFSEAMRLGAMLGPQAFGYDFSGEEDAASCAFGAAVSGAGLQIKSVQSVEDEEPEVVGELLRAKYARIAGYVLLPPEWGSLRIIKAECCVAGCKYNDCVLGVVTHLNDNHRWTRQEIADWVEQFEEQTPAPAEIRHEEVTTK